MPTKYEIEAQKVLGKNGKLPKPTIDPASVGPAWSKAMASWGTSKDNLHKCMRELANEEDRYKALLREYLRLVTDSDFGLDPRKPDDKKKIDGARQIMKKGLDVWIRSMDSNACMVDSLNDAIKKLQDQFSKARCTNPSPF